jgi:hypothetical protein
MRVNNLLHSLLGPIVIGGVGGSGTRVVAEILRSLDIFIGNDLNVSLDNLSYTLLFKRRRWYYLHQYNNQVLSRGLDILEKTMIPAGKLTLSDYIFIARAIIEMSAHGHNADRNGNGFWPLARALKIIRSKTGIKTVCHGWGWKEPNSHLLIGVLNTRFPSFRYIHCIRHGLDMAFSTNQQQLYNWGPLFGVLPPTDPAKLPEASFRYWVESNRRAKALGEKIGGKRFLTVNFDDLCRDPRNGIQRITGFLGVEPDNGLMEQLILLPRPATSTGRYKDRDISWVNRKDIAFLESMGFSM